ncbi:MAG: hypothetical protein ACTSVY_00395 [Candidatus Helarchaeota archaeon]
MEESSRVEKENEIDPKTKTTVFQEEGRAFFINIHVPKHPNRK